MKKDCIDNNFIKYKAEHQMPFTKEMALRLSLYLGIILNVILAVGYSYNGNLLFKNLPVVIAAAFSTILLTYFLFRYNFYVIKTNGKRRFLFFIRSNVLSFVFAIGFSLAVSSVMTTFIHVESGRSMYISITLMKDLMAALVVQLITYLLFSLHQNQQNIVKNQQLLAENIRTRYEALKSQIDPHFLFNSLNTLDGLISMNTDKAHEYVQNLSAVFRYTIGNKEITKLEDELDFTQSYVELMKIRYGENLQVHFNIKNSYLQWLVMPVSLQLLVENAIKHNVISNKLPLNIHIETTPENNIRVWNPIQQKNETEPGERVGLGNLSERYKLLFNKEITVSATDIFMVEFPLIENTNELNTSI